MVHLASALVARALTAPSIEAGVVSLQARLPMADRRSSMRLRLVRQAVDRHRQDQLADAAGAGHLIDGAGVGGAEHADVGRPGKGCRPWSAPAGRIFLSRWVVGRGQGADQRVLVGPCGRSTGRCSPDHRPGHSFRRRPSCSRGLPGRPVRWRRSWPFCPGRWSGCTTRHCAPPVGVQVTLVGGDQIAPARPGLGGVRRSSCSCAGLKRRPLAGCTELQVGQLEVLLRG